jgi:fused signal recognition particle receptor
MFGFKRNHKNITKEAAQEAPLAITEESPQNSSQSLFSRLRSGMSKTSSALGEGITGIFTKRKLDDATLEELEEVLIMSDMGATVAARICDTLRKERFDKESTPDEIRHALAHILTDILVPVQQPLTLEAAHSPTVIMVVGVNGNGKTTTIGKLALRYQREGKKVMLAAADTFRAAAVEQLAVWAERAHVPLVRGAHEADPASVAHQAYERAKAEGIDVLLIDTAGRLHNKLNLMEELAKITRVLGKLESSAPHHTLMVLDGTTGQNALSQVAAFQECTPLTGLAVTKLDGTAKGGVVVSLAEKVALPIHFVGVGEGIEDLQPFDAAQFSLSLVGLSDYTQ